MSQSCGDEVFDVRPVPIFNKTSEMDLIYMYYRCIFVKDFLILRALCLQLLERERSSEAAV